MKGKDNSSESIPMALASRIAAYSIATGSVLSLNGQANAEIKYSDPTDTLLDTHGETLSVDLNGDSTTDATFTYTLSGGTAKVSVQPGASASVRGPNGTPQKLVVGNTVNVDPTWGNGGMLNSYYVGVGGGGPFIGAEGFVGVKFDIEGTPLYGWVRYKGNSTAGGYVKDWAYEDSGAAISIPTVYDAAGWSGGAPASSTTDAVINSDLSVTSNLETRNLIHRTGTLTFNGTNTITIHGSMYGYGQNKQLDVGGSIVLHSPAYIYFIPIPGGGGTLLRTGTTLSWTKATDGPDSQSALQYRVYQSATANLTTVANVEAATEITGGWQTDIATWSTGVDANKWHNVIVKDEDGNKAIYTQVEADN